MKRFRQIVLFLLLTASAVPLLGRPDLSAAAIEMGLHICAHSILPVLFPFFIWTNLWIALGYAQTLCIRLGPVTERVFHLPGSAASPMLLGALGGNPVGAVTTAHLYQQNLLSKEEAERCLFFCCNAGPSFLVGLLGGVILQDLRLGYLLWGIHLLSAIFLGIVHRPPLQSDRPQIRQIVQRETSFVSACTGAIRDAGTNILQVCTFVLCFSVLSVQLRTLLPDSHLTSFFLASLELASGADTLRNTLQSRDALFVTLAGLAGWGGLCVHFQSLSAICSTGLAPASYLCGKLAHSIVSTVFAALITPLLPETVPCFHTEGLPGFVVLPGILLLLLTLLAKTASGKTERFPL